LPLPGPSTRSSGSITTTERSRGSRPSSPPPAGAATSHFSPHSHAWLSRQRRATLTPGWPLAGQRSTAAAACARARPGQIRNRRSPARLRTTSAGSPPSRPTRAVDRAARTPQTTCNSIRSSREGCPPHRRDPQGHPWASASETEVTGRTGGHQPAGHRTAGHRTAGQPDPGHRNRGGHRMVDTDRRRTAWQALAFPTAAATPYRWGAVRKLGRSDAAWSISNQDSSTERTLPRRVWPPPRPDSDRVTLPRPAGASAHCSRVLDWDGTREGQWDYGKVGCAGSGWRRSANGMLRLAW
jgi:hypothetical protein